MLPTITTRATTMTTLGLAVKCPWWVGVDFLSMLKLPAGDNFHRSAYWEVYHPGTVIHP